MSYRAYLNNNPLCLADKAVRRRGKLRLTLSLLRSIIRSGPPLRFAPGGDRATLCSLNVLALATVLRYP